MRIFEPIKSLFVGHHVAVVNIYYLWPTFIRQWILTFSELLVLNNFICTLYTDVSANIASVILSFHKRSIIILILNID